VSVFDVNYTLWQLKTFLFEQHTSVIVVLMGTLFLNELLHVHALPLFYGDWKN